MTDDSPEPASIVDCFVCQRSTGHGLSTFAGRKGEEAVLAAACCSPECDDEARRFAARRSAQADPAAAGLLVAGLGVVTALFFIATSRELGRLLLVFSLFGAGTSRLAYPDAVPTRLAQRLGLTKARVTLQWLGVGLCSASVALGIGFLLAD